MTRSPAILVAGVGHRYGARAALDNVSLTVPRGEIFVLLGPNGSGKSTLFRLLSTLAAVQVGQIEILGNDVKRHSDQVRRQIGVAFQSPSLDKKLTASENLQFQGRLYGLSNETIRHRTDELFQQFRLVDRADDYCETLSGGQRRRVELAKVLLHTPPVLLLDEPSTGLDPSARRDLWQVLLQLRGQGVTVALTTHLLEEAEQADRVAILDQGVLVACDPPAALRATVGGETLTIDAEEPHRLASEIAQRFGCRAWSVDGQVRLEATDAPQLMPRLFVAFPGRIHALSWSRPTLADVFFARTGRTFQGRESLETAHG